MRTSRFLWVIFIVVFGVQLMYAGYVITVTEEFYAPEISKTITRVYIEGNLMRMDFEDEGQKQAILFNKSSQEMWMINYTKGTYTKIDREKMREIYSGAQSQISEAMEKMKAEMEKLPPEQRAMIEEMMKGQMPGQPGKVELPKREVKKVANNQKINKWVVDKYEIYEDGQLVQESWVVSPGKLAAAATVQPFFQAMANFWKDILPKVGDGEMDLGMFITQEFNEIPGLPVLEKEYENGKLIRKMELQELIKQDIKPSLLEVPKNLRFIDMTEYMGMR